MRRSTRSIRVAAAAVVMMTACVAVAQSPTATDPIELRAKEFARAVNTGRADALERLVADSFGGQIRNAPMAANMAILMGYWDTSRGLEFERHYDRKEDAQAHQAVVLFRNNLTRGHSAIVFQLEPASPHRIIGVWPTLEQAAAEAPRPLSKKQIARELDAFMGRLADADVFSGAVLLAKDGAIVFKRSYGQSNKDAGSTNRIDTRFNLGSMNKMFTAVAIAQLAERGQLSYEDPLAKFLPEFPDAEAAQKIQIKHLLAHAAGLGMWWTSRYAPAPKDSFRSVDDMMKWAAGDQNRQFEPGTRYQYSNTGFVVLGKVIEQVTGMSYYDYVRKNIYERAGMSGSDSYERDHVNPNIAVGYHKSFDAQGRPYFRNNTFVNTVRGGPHGGGYSTVEDLLRFDQALRSGLLLDKNSVRLLQTAKPELHAVRYGYGFDVDAERDTAGHAGGGMGNSNNIDMFQRSGWTAVVLSNYTQTGFEVSTPVVEKMRELIRTAAQ